MAAEGSTGPWIVGSILFKKMGLVGLPGSGSPTNGSSGTGAGKVGIGGIYTDYTNGVRWMNVGTKASPTWSPLDPVIISVSSANILAMNGAPVTLIAAPPTGFLLLVSSITLEMTTTATAYANGGVVSFVYHGGSTAAHSGTIPAAVVTAGAGTTFTMLGPATGSNGTTIPTATALDITNGTAPFITGTGTAKAIIAYRVVKE